MATRTGDAGHFLQSRLGIAVEVEAPNAQNGVEGAVFEGDAFALGQCKKQAASGVAIPTSRQRTLGDVNAGDG
jgi:hypothetical protein